MSTIAINTFLKTLGLHTQTPDVFHQSELVSRVTIVQLLSAEMKSARQTFSLRTIFGKGWGISEGFQKESKVHQIHI